MLLNVYKILRVESWNNQHMVTFLWPHVRAMVHPKSLEHSNLTSLLEFFTELQKEVLRFDFYLLTLSVIVIALISFCVFKLVYFYS
ncbi:hypothetical protein HanRHA438_Chr16g0765741 [Helianthus annuus]|nr:hypothetical protein HanHA89_Chr10g0399991 [Helianthus annuus]KAJ0776491.1 hypothetical protein HanLR1_Chr02g0046251 [Helianthus annuus]KAJ0836329.1 hypothetical protein HanRHA438_Chr16g0765741 [Helianthus annuus]